MELTSNLSLTDLNYSEMEALNGGAWYTAVLTFAGGIATTVGAASLIGGASVSSMAVGALAACGPVGWAIIGIGAVGGVATGLATVDAYRK
ncbi:hypothetical protein [Clostridium thermarum]|uniref:hypothetical protein n=1 Tax=Clostridium thermarum TaxID=1716543 RepID=UPI00111F0D2F|nr:hypothetical protein [Clostridium thermarum]